MNIPIVRPIACPAVPARFRSPRWLLVIAVFLFTVLYTLISWISGRGYDIWDEEPAVPPLPTDVRKSLGSWTDAATETRCRSFPEGIFDTVQVVMKVGSSEVHKKLAAHLKTNTACVPNLLIFSDYEEQAMNHHVYDALGHLPKEHWYHNDDVHVYRKIHQIKAMGGTMVHSAGGWKLDKYKWLPMMDLTWHMRTNKEFYVFLEADTYIVWDNLFRWIRHLDPEKELFTGSPVWQNELLAAPFAHGGSGIVLSRGGLRRLVRPPGEPILSPLPGSTQFGLNLKEMCCGDVALSDLFRKRRVYLKGYWPMFSGEKPTTLRFGRRDEIWCEPAIMFHHVNEAEMKAYWQWEMRREETKPLVYEDIYNWNAPLLEESRISNWTVVADDGTFTLPDPAGESPDKCQEACANDPKCFQFEHHDDTCHLSYWIRAGHERLPDEDKGEWVAGRMLDRIAEFRNGQPHCKHAHFVRPNPS